MSKRLPLGLIVELRNRGMSLREVAQELGSRGIKVSHTAIGKLLHREKITSGIILLPKQSINEFDIKEDFERLYRFTAEFYKKEQQRLQEIRMWGNRKEEAEILSNLSRLERVQKRISKVYKKGAS